MGGRGSTSQSGKIKVGNDFGGGLGDIGFIDETPDQRKDINTMFVGELGFKAVQGTNGLDTAVIGSMGVQLNNLERRYGAIGVEPNNMVLQGVANTDFNAAVSRGNKTLYIDVGNMDSISNIVKGKRNAEKSGWSMPTDGSVKSHARYTITHEYGHILQNSMYSKAVKSGYKGTQDEFARNASNEIIKIAQTKYGGSQKDLSTYGAKNTAEFFAESFANANLGNPNALGKAMNDYLKNNGY